MESNQQEAVEFGGRTVPPATPPVINDNASASDAVRAGGGDSDFPGRAPDEIQPGQGDFDRPSRSPEQEVPGQGGDFDQPGQSPAETPPQPIEPSITPPPD